MTTWHGGHENADFWNRLVVVLAQQGPLPRVAKPATPAHEGLEDDESLEEACRALVFGFASGHPIGH